MKKLPVNWPPSSRYILAVSGGADSMVLLDLFVRAASEHKYELIVAHFDHGIRTDSAADRRLVEDAAAHHSLPFEAQTANLRGSGEAAARAARDTWLEQVRQKRHAAAILTAHHQDDLIETSLLNLARGTNRLGLAPMAASPTILRPLLGTSRAKLREYACARDVVWHEDSTNADQSNPLNFLRLSLLPSASLDWRNRYLELIATLTELNTKIDQSISEMLESARLDPQTYSFPTAQITDLDTLELQELIVAASRALQPGIQLDEPLIREIAAFAKNATTGKFRPLRQGVLCVRTRKGVNLTTNVPH